LNLVACTTATFRFFDQYVSMIFAWTIADDARDPNWRRRPSVLDRLLGLTAPRCRPHYDRLCDCRRSAAPYRRRGIARNMHHGPNFSRMGVG
jgi:hypothetical protein